jgi:protein disulfide-isomerase
MKKIVMFVFALSLGLSTFASGKQWMTNLDEAMKLSNKSGKPILIEFSGSNWCPPCMMLNKNVFSKKAFLDFAKENLVLVLMDFPRPSKQTDKQKKYNNNIARKYKIQFFPTVFLLDGKGKVITKIEQSGDVKKYIALLKTKIPAKKAKK